MTIYLKLTIKGLFNDIRLNDWHGVLSYVKLLALYNDTNMLY